MHTDGHRIGVINRELRVGFQCLCHRLCGVLLPKWIPLLGVITHRERRAVAHLRCHSVPNEFPARCPTEVPDVISLEDPGFQTLCSPLLRLDRFLLVDDHDWLIERCSGLLEALALGRGQHRFGILELTCRCHHVVRRNRDFHMVIPEIQRELTRTEELFVLPAFIVAIHHHPRVKLSNRINRIVFLFEQLITAAATDGHSVIDVVPPFHIKDKLASGLQWRGQVHPHHGLVDGVGQVVARRICNFLNFEPTIKPRLKISEAFETVPVLDA